MIKKKILYITIALLIIGLLFVGINLIGSSNNGTSSFPINTVYAETLKNINTNMDDLMSLIEKEMIENPKTAMMGSPISIIKESQYYKNIINLGLNAVKPLYDKLYESHEAGLYEYILALAIQEITQEDFVYNTTYGWKNSLEFRLCYETKVNNVQFNVEKIINDENLSDEQKTTKLKEQGIFAVSALINEYNNKDSKLSKKVIEDAIKDISSTYNTKGTSSMAKISINAEDNKTSDFINENKSLFDSLVDLNGKAYN